METIRGAYVLALSVVGALTQVGCMLQPLDPGRGPRSMVPARALRKPCGLWTAHWVQALATAATGVAPASVRNQTLDRRAGDG